MNYEQELEKLFETTITENASDLHLSEGRYPTIRVSGQLIPIVSSQILTHEDIKQFVNFMIPESNVKDFDLNSKELDFSYKYKDKARFRCNAFHQQGLLSMSLRFIPKTVRTVTYRT
jgi:twitching motility protein PilT